MSLDKYLKGSSDEFNYIGERLSILRKKLEKEFEDYYLLNNDTKPLKRDNPYSVESVAAALGLTYNSLNNIENSKSITHNVIKYIIFLYSLGYNPLWIIVPDNFFVPEKIISDNLVDNKELKKNYKKLYFDIENNTNAILDYLDDFKKNNL